jgi:YidC/Oxa1 family membrane protein insertase
MDQQRPLLYLTLLFLGFMIWTTWKHDHAPKPVATDNTASTQATNTADGQPAPNQAQFTGSDVPQQSVPASATHTDINAPAAGQAQASPVIRIKTDTLNLTISTKGGDIIYAALPTYPVSLEKQDTPVVILTAEKSYAAQSGLGHAQIAGQDASKLAPNHYALYAAAQSEYTLADGQDTLVVPLTWTNNNGITVTKRYNFKRGSFLVGVEHEVSNASGQVWSGFEYRQLRHGPAEMQTGGIFGGVRAYIGAAYYNFEDGKYKYEKISYDEFDDPDEKVNKKITGGWAAMLEHYFVSAWAPANNQENIYYTNYQTANNGTPSSILGLKTPVTNIPNGSSHVFKTNFYVGPKIQETLEKIAPGLELTVDYGIFTVISKPIFWLLKQMHNIFGNWGWAIIFVTIIIKILFFWPSAVSYKSMAKMKKLAPKMKEMQTRFKDDPQAKQKAMMDFYRKEKINPLGGCLPMLIQIPVFMGLYWVLLESVELRQAPWLLWYKDLSVMDPYFVLPLLMGLSMWFQQKLNPPQMDEMQQKIFKWLPVVFTVLFLFFPAGLVLYWLVNNVLSMAQQWFINKKIIGDT